LWHRCASKRRCACDRGIVLAWGSIDTVRRGADGSTERSCTERERSSHGGHRRRRGASAPRRRQQGQARARGLFEAIVNDDPERAEAFWFPREPFIPLKDIKDPGKYWNQLHRAYANDVHALHKKRKSWDGAEFVSFEGWSRPKWVPPGDEANKIGYHRAFNGRLRYKVGGEDAEIEVHTLITWQGRWFVTHLRRVKH
jgi:hypothetical protein